VHTQTHTTEKVKSCFQLSLVLDFLSHSKQSSLLIQAQSDVRDGNEQAALNQLQPWQLRT